MNASDISWAGLAASLLLVVIAVALSWWQGLRLERSIIWASTRATVQLLLVGSALAIVFQQSVWLAWLWVTAMVVVAAYTVRLRAPEVPGAFALALFANGTVAIVTLGIIFGFGIFPVTAQAIIPIAGMQISNAMAASVVVARRIVAELRDNRAEIEARLALGQASRDAAQPYVRAAMRTALMPQIESTKIVGLIALPGAMTGLILAGVSPANAVKVQLAVMFLLLGSMSTSVTVIGLGLTRRLFTVDHRLVRLERVAG